MTDVPFNVPAIEFGPWHAWNRRKKLADEWDVPAWIDFGGLYMLARFDPGDAVPAGPAIPIQEQVVYIGKSHRLTGRTQYHPKARRYSSTFLDLACANLYLATCDFGFGWGYSDLKHGSYSSAKRAYVAYTERKAIWQFASAHGRAPALNIA